MGNSRQNTPKSHPARRQRRDRGRFGGLGPAAETAAARFPRAVLERAAAEKNGCLYFRLGVVRIFSKFGAGCIFFQYLVTNLFLWFEQGLFNLYFFGNILSNFLWRPWTSKPNSVENKTIVGSKAEHWSMCPRTSFMIHVVEWSVDRSQRQDRGRCGCQDAITSGFTSASVRGMPSVRCARIHIRIGHDVGSSGAA